jgi:hypothetical protein
MAEKPKDPGIDIEPLDDDALEDVSGGSSGGCCSCSGCSSPPSDPPVPDDVIYV